MVDVNEFVKLQDGNKDEADFKLATVSALFETGTAKITFFGEDIPSEKEYSYLSSYKPAIGDTVLVVPFGETYIIAGRVLFQAVLPDGATVTIEDVNSAIETHVSAALEDYVTGDILSGTYIERNGETYDITVANYAYIKKLKHTGTALGFFNATPSTKRPQSIISSSATLTQLISAHNNLVDALNDYGLV